MADYKRTYNLLLVDDHQLMIDGLAGILRQEEFTEAIYTANDGRSAVDHAMHHEIDCVLMDINMPNMNGLEATKVIKEQKPGTKIIVISMIEDTSVVVKLLKAGADGFILKNTGRDELVKAIGKVMNNEKYVCNEISQNLYSHISLRKTPGESEGHLTPRETEIVRYIGEGLTNQEIAAKLFLSPSTVDTHRKNILTKLGLKNTAALVKYAAENHLL